MSDDTTGTAADLVIRYTPGDGVTLEGSTKGDGVWEILRTLGINWRAWNGILYIRGSRDKDIAQYRGRIERTRAALAADGRWTVAVDVEEGYRPAAERRADADDRAADRAASLRDRAGRAEDTAAAHRHAGRTIAGGIPFGQPILSGHHSEGRHRRDLARMQRHDEKQFAAMDAADRLAERAAGAARNAAHRHNPRAILRRIEKLEADRRGYARELEGYERKSYNGRGEVVYVDRYEAATGRRADDLRRWDERDAEEIAALRAELAQMEAAGTFAAWGPEHFVKGDRVRVGPGVWVPVLRINKKSLTVPWIIAAMDGRDTDATDRVPWDAVHGRRRDGYQWDSPNGEPWPVALADKVARWRNLTGYARVAHQHSYDSDQARDARHVGYAVRLVHGLPLTAADAQVKAITDSITDTDARRALVAAYVDVFDRLTAGELVPDIAATLTPITGEPAWTLPTDQEPEECHPTDLRPGDLVAGIRGGGGPFAGTRDSIDRTFCGPVEHVSAVTDYRELDAWVTVRLTNGLAREMRTYRWVLVHRAANPTEPADPAPTDTMAVGQCGRCGWHNAISGAAQTVTCAGPDCATPVHLGDVRPAGPTPLPPVTITTPTEPAAEVAASVRSATGQAPDTADVWADVDTAPPVTFTIVSGPHPPTRTVRVCDLGGENLPDDAGWWLVQASGAGWRADRGAGCAEHTGQAPVPMPVRERAPRGTAAALEVAAERANARNTHRAHPVTSGPFCIAYDNAAPGPHIAGERSTFVRADVTCRPCLDTYAPGGDDPTRLAALAKHRAAGAAVALNMDPVAWAGLPAAAKHECAALDHGTFRCPHHPEPYPPYRLPAVGSTPETVAWCVQRDHPWVTFSPWTGPVDPETGKRSGETWCRCGAERIIGRAELDADAQRETHHTCDPADPGSCRCYVAEPPRAGVA